MTPADPGQPSQQALVRSPAADEHPRPPLFGPDEMEGIVNRWRDIQVSFVDDPRKAVKDADVLVAELMQRLTQMFASQHEQLEAGLTTGDSLSTEDLRQGLRRYRSFFERLLAA
jgi:hypothetical protein